jgi:hypothetical protein
MFEIPSSHKTVFLFDYTWNFGKSSSEQIDIEISKGKAQPSEKSFQNSLFVSKSLWASAAESFFEFSRIVYDVFPENKLISAIISRPEFDPLRNKWCKSDQSYDNVEYIFKISKQDTGSIKKDSSLSLNTYYKE